MGQFVSVDVIGASAEGRNLSVVKICQGGCGKKPIIFIEAGDAFNRPKSTEDLTFIGHYCFSVSVSVERSF